MAKCIGTSKSTSNKKCLFGDEHFSTTSHRLFLMDVTPVKKILATPLETMYFLKASNNIYVGAVFVP